MGGQKTLRSYWRNYFEKTDALIWVVDATDRLRIEDCKEELIGLLLEERLMGASLLVFANKTDVDGCMLDREIQDVYVYIWCFCLCLADVAGRLFIWTQSKHTNGRLFGVAQSLAST